MTSIRSAISVATSGLEAITETPRLDAELLMAHALGTDRNTVLLSRMDDPAPEGFEPLIARRSAREPVAYITGTRDFWTLSLIVTPDVLIPRPETETLIEQAIAHFARAGLPGPKTILDLGTGSGALICAALYHWPEARGVAMDASPDALAVARRNAEGSGLVDRTEFRMGDWATGIEEQFDLVLCNPPYIRRDAVLQPEVLGEPHQALFGGEDGLDDYRLLAPQFARLVAPRGCVCVEFGYGLGAAITALMRAQGFDVVSHKDLAGIDRCLVLTRSA